MADLKGNLPIYGPMMAYNGPGNAPMPQADPRGEWNKPWGIPQDPTLHHVEDRTGNTPGVIKYRGSPPQPWSPSPDQGGAMRADIGHESLDMMQHPQGLTLEQRFAGVTPYPMDNRPGDQASLLLGLLNHKSAQ